MSDPKIFHKLKDLIQQHILGQSDLIDALLISLIADGHLLVEGAPGLAKTKAISTLASYLDADFQRIQFTPDLLPSDITGTEIFRPQTAEFVFQQGPVFHNLILADEINRAPAKVQAALLEAMAERQVSAGGKTRPLAPLFLVMATQNPIEQEGTYPLPEAQLDRFLMHVIVDYPSHEHEVEVMRTVRGEHIKTETVDRPQLSQEAVFQARQACQGIAMAEEIEDYIVELVQATRQPGKYSKEFAKSIDFGASPRASIALDRCSRVKAWLDGRDYVTPGDVQALAPSILRHRIGLSFSALSQGYTPSKLVDELLILVSAP